MILLSLFLSIAHLNCTWSALGLSGESGRYETEVQCFGMQQGVGNPRRPYMSHGQTSFQVNIYGTYMTLLGCIQGVLIMTHISACEKALPSRSCFDAQLSAGACEVTGGFFKDYGKYCTRGMDDTNPKNFPDFHNWTKQENTPV